jgi:5-methylcytosine-specific restriction enzyme A
MPTAPLRPCPAPGCPVLGPCSVHGAQRDRDRMARAPWRAWYMNPSGRWRHPNWGLRATVLGNNPWCVTCQQRGILEPATDVDHIVPHRGDPDRFWDRENLQGLCRGCHAAKTGRGA